MVEGGRAAQVEDEDGEGVEVEGVVLEEQAGAGEGGDADRRAWSGGAGELEVGVEGARGVLGGLSGVAEAGGGACMGVECGGVGGEEEDGGVVEVGWVAAEDCLEGGVEDEGGAGCGGDADVGVVCVEDGVDGLAVEVVWAEGGLVELRLDVAVQAEACPGALLRRARSEERRVGKECQP